MRRLALVYSRRYAYQLEDIYGRIAADNSGAASRLVGRIGTAVERLTSFPEIGRPGRVVGTRELVTNGTPYIVPYRVKDDTVQIITILHSPQRWPAMLPD